MKSEFYNIYTTMWTITIFRKIIITTIIIRRIIFRNDLHVDSAGCRSYDPSPVGYEPADLTVHPPPPE